MSGNNHYCFICGQISERESNISYHRIQKGREDDWLRIVGLTSANTTIKVENVQFCNRHFVPSDFHIGKSGKRRLKKNTIPSIKFLDDSTFQARKMRITNTNVVQNCRNVHPVNNLRMNRGQACILCKDKTKSGSSVFRFPNDERRILWLNACKLVDVPKNAFLCYQHFERQCFFNLFGTAGRARLEKNAIPTIFEFDRIDKNESAASSSELNSEVHKDPEVNNVDHSCTTEQNDSETIDEPMEMELDNVKETDAPTASTPSTSRHDFNLVTSDIQADSLECDNRENSPVRKLKKPRYSGDIKSPHLKDKEMIDHSFKLMKSTIEQQKRKINVLQKQLNRRTARIKNLLESMNELRRQGMLSENAMENVMETLPEVLQSFNRRTGGKKCEQYASELRQFALTLQFYSARAYDFVRKSFHNLLPHPATIRQWLCSLDARPGFNRDVLESLKKIAEAKKEDVVCNLIIDSISIKTQTIRKHGRRFGCVDFGINPFTGDALIDEKNEKATHALVFMIVDLKGTFKATPAYFLISSINGKDLANLVTIMLQLLDEYKIKIHSTTFDGEAVNGAMIKALGYNMDVLSDKFRPYFTHPAERKENEAEDKVFVFPDPSHSEKNVRNALAETGPFYDADGLIVDWTHILALVTIQNEEGLYMTKLTERHINIKENKMNVRLAVQVLSNSVSEALTYLEDKVVDMRHGGNQSTAGTAKFCKIFNDAFDILNCRQRLNNNTAKQPYRIPLCPENMEKLKKRAEEIEEYICGLIDAKGQLLINGRRKCGFVGFVVGLRNMFSLYEELHSKSNYEYFLTYKISQDMLETFFSAVRIRGGFCNNPTSYQFQYAMRRLITHQQVAQTKNGNCSPDDIPFLTVTSTRKKTSTDKKEDEEPEEHNYAKVFEDFDEFEEGELFDFDCEIPSQYVQEVVKYIAGYIVKKFKQGSSMKTCSNCYSSIVGEPGSSKLIDIKNRGFLCCPSEQLFDFCLLLEKVIRSSKDDIYKANFEENILKKLTKSDSNQRFFVGKHFEDNEEHYLEFVSFVGKMFLTVRMNHEEKKNSKIEHYIRHFHKKIVLFQHQ